RLPQPKRLQGEPLPVPPPSRELNPYSARIIDLLDEMVQVTGLSHFVILTDWLGMIEGTLQMWATQLRTIALEGTVAPDPPAIETVYRQARERYQFVSESRPQAYRKMQAAFVECFHLLRESAGPDLETYAGQTTISPNVVGEVFITCLGHPRAWAPYVTPWEEALARAAKLIPNGHDLVYERLAVAALEAREDGITIRLEPGENFEVWYEAIAPYMPQLVVGRPLIDLTTTSLLAVAARFPAWLVKRDHIRLVWSTQTDPLIQRLNHINAMLFGLNGYVLEQLDAHNEILSRLEAELTEESPATLRVPAVTHPERIYTDADRPRPTPPAETDRSFTTLFRREKE
ncbi:MAG: hypothetical protein KDI79_09705, partial [Anaerolineae bacterium]|nr:hypothetical protein [Anaerolineae bacterium]